MAPKFSSSSSSNSSFFKPFSSQSSPSSTSSYDMPSPAQTSSPSASSSPVLPNTALSSTVSLNTAAPNANTSNASSNKPPQSNSANAAQSNSPRPPSSNTASPNVPSPQPSKVGSSNAFQSNLVPSNAAQPNTSTQQLTSNTVPKNTALPSTAKSNVAASTTVTPASKFSLVARTSGRTFGASDFIWQLIELVAQDITRFKRNSWTSHAIIANAQALYDEINVLIKKVDSDDIDDWSNYDRYNAAIDALEDLLFKVADVTDQEAAQLLLPNADMITDCITSVNTWQQHRQKIRGYLREFHSGAAFNSLLSSSKPDGVVMGKRDDMELLSVICDGISDSSLRDGWSIKVKNEAPKLSRKIVDATTDDSMLHTIRSMMLFHGAMGIVASSSATNVLKKQLQSDKVGKKAESLLVALDSHLQKGRSSPADDKALADEVDAFEKALLELPGVATLSPTWIELRKLAKDIKRPYRAQAIVLVTQTLTLVKHFALDGNNNTENLKPLTNAIDAAMKAMQTAAAQAIPTTGSIDVNNIQSSPAGVAFAGAEVEVHRCFTKYGLNTEWAHQKKIAEATEDDKKRVSQMNARVGKLSQTAPAGRTIVVTIHKGRTSVSYAMDESTTLSAILHKEASQDPTLLHGWHFEQVIDGRNRRRGLHEDVKALKSSDQTKRTLYLVAD